MLIVEGKYNKAKIFTDNVEQEAIESVINVCNNKSYKDSVIRVMSDIHNGKDCVIGFTMRNFKSVNPNLVGVDIGCGVSGISLKNIDNDNDKYLLLKNPNKDKMLKNLQNEVKDIDLYKDINFIKIMKDIEEAKLSLTIPEKFIIREAIEYLSEVVFNPEKFENENLDFSPSMEKVESQLNYAFRDLKNIKGFEGKNNEKILKKLLFNNLDKYIDNDESLDNFRETCLYCLRDCNFYFDIKNEAEDIYIDIDELDIYPHIEDNNKNNNFQKKEKSINQNSIDM